jgi:hypothetical protein
MIGQPKAAVKVLLLLVLIPGAALARFDTTQVRRKQVGGEARSFWFGQS